MEGNSATEDRFRHDGDGSALARWRSGGQRAPTHAVWEITLRCDLGCSHCGSRAGKPRDNELTTKEALDLVDELADLEIREVTLIGGEFYLRNDWDQIAAKIEQSGMYCSIVTGARQMTPARIAQAVKAGVSRISISIDGLEDTHDIFRGSKGSWKAAIGAGRNIVAAGIDLSVNTQINRLTMPELVAIAEGVRDLGAGSWMVMLTAAMGRGADHPALMLQPYHLLHLFPLLAKIKADILDPNRIGFFPANNVGYFGPVAETLRYGAQSGSVWSGCQAGSASLGIEADGRVKGCPSLPSLDYTGGFTRHSPMKEIVAHLQAKGPMVKEDQLWGFCQSCQYAARCRGGCTWTAHVLFGRPGNNPYCHYRALIQASRGVAETVVPLSSASGAPFDHGLMRLQEVDLDAVSNHDLLIEMTLVAQVVGLASGLKSALPRDDIAKLIAP